MKFKVRPVRVAVCVLATEASCLPAGMEQEVLAMTEVGGLAVD